MPPASTEQSGISWQAVVTTLLASHRVMTVGDIAKAVGTKTARIDLLATQLTSSGLLQRSRTSAQRARYSLTTKGLRGAAGLTPSMQQALTSIINTNRVPAPQALRELQRRALITDHTVTTNGIHVLVFCLYRDHIVMASPNVARFIVALSENSCAARSDIAKRAGINRREVRRLGDRLETAHVVVRCTDRQPAKYRFTPLGEQLAAEVSRSPSSFTTRDLVMRYRAGRAVHDLAAEADLPGESLDQLLSPHRLDERPWRRPAGVSAGPLPPAAVASVIERYQRGEVLRTLAEQFDRSPATISSLLRDHGVEIRSRAFRKKAS